jgi:DNA-binding XRE family transcriptional regulator
MMKSAETKTRFVNYIRIHRRRIGLTQAELSEVLGYLDRDTIARHEQFAVLPPLEVAIGYERIFRVPVAELFAGLGDVMAARIESGLAQLEERLGQRSAKDSNALTTARKLTWLAGWKQAKLEEMP